MSVDSTNISQSFTKDGSTKTFAFTFSALRSSPEDIKCKLINATNSATISTLAYTTDYSVVVNADGDGGVLTVVNSAGTDTLFVYRDTTDKQESDYTDYNQFPADTVEHDFDRRTLRSQESDDAISRAVKFAITSNISDADLPTPVDGQGLKWSGTNGTLVNAPIDSASTLAASSATVAASSAALAASSATVAQAATKTIDSITITTSADIALLTAALATLATVTISSGTIASVVTGVTQTPADNSTKLATTAYADAAVVSDPTLTVGTLTVTTKATIADIAITAGIATALTVTTVNLSAGTIAGEVTGVTQGGSDNSTKLATTAYADAVGGADPTLTVGTLTVNTSATINNLTANLATVDTLNVTTSATIAMVIATAVTVSSLKVTGTATVTEVITSTLNVPTSATIAILDAGVATAGNLTVTTRATIAQVGVGLATVGTITITTKATIILLDAPTITGTTATITNIIGTLITATTISMGASIVTPDISKSITVEDAVTGDEITLFKVPSASTIYAMWAVVTGTSPSAFWGIKHGTDRNGAGAWVNTAGTTTTDITTGDTITVFTDATIAANSWVWLSVPTVTGTVSTLNVTINYKQDA